MDSDRDPPPHCGLNPSKCFFFFLKLPLPPPNPHWICCNKKVTSLVFKSVYVGGQWTLKDNVQKAFFFIVTASQYLSSRPITSFLWAIHKGSKKTKQKKHFDGFNPQWGGGFQSESTFHVFFLLFNVKICLKIGKER